jgi:lysine-specific demethylase/histidyl-hydroxylase NO66
LKFLFKGRARPAIVWDSYNEGCSVRILNPHTYSTTVWKLLSCLQEYFGSLVGANTYLTPPGSQGFAPHYGKKRFYLSINIGIPLFLDDIDAFILQLEGKKHWRVYKPLNDDEVLPLKSSGDLDKHVVDGIKPCIDVVLEAGDLLYMPRGYIHQGNTLDDSHSLHLTVSCYQQNTWGDLFKILLPKAVDYGQFENQFSK